RRPTLVSFNGRTFDLPLLELAAFRYGLSVPAWFNCSGKAYDQPRNRYNTECHLDLHDVLTNFGASRFNGGLNLVANLLGKPGKMDVQGHMVQDLWNEVKLTEINEYCRCDVLDTYFAFLRTMVLLGNLKLDDEQRLGGEVKDFLSKRATTNSAVGCSSRCCWARRVNSCRSRRLSSCAVHSSLNRHQGEWLTRRSRRATSRMMIQATVMMAIAPAATMATRSQPKSQSPGLG